jgi:hypothetical protein
MECPQECDTTATAWRADASAEASCPMPADVRSASISITFDNGRTIVDPLLIGPQ